MKTLAFALLSSFCAAAAAAPEVDALIAAARQAPGEFAADALIRLGAIESLDPARRIELLEQAFQRAAGAQHPYKRAVALPRMQGPVRLVSKVFAQEMDGLSLRLRAVEAMTALDVRKARTMFAQIPTLKFPKSTCADFLVYDAGAYYDVLEKILRSADVADRSGLLERASAEAGSAVQIGGMARVLAAADVPGDAWQRALDAFGKSLGKISGDDRSFGSARNAGLQIEVLTEECKRRKLSPLAMLEGYRVYLVFNLSSVRCADNSALQETGLRAFADTEPQTLDPLVHFNQKLRMAPLQAIHELESTPTRIEGAAVAPKACQDAKCTELSGMYGGLMFKADGTPALAPDRNTPEWEAKLKEILQSLAAWKQSPTATPVEMFREKASAYGSLLNLAPAGSARNLVLRAMLELAAGNPVQKTDRLAWFLAVNGLIARTSLDPAGYRSFSEQLRKSSDPVIALYAGLESVAPRPADRVLSLL